MFATLFLFPYFFGGVRKDVLVLFHSLSLPFSLSLCCIIFTLNDGLIIFYVSFFFDEREKKKKRKNEVWCVRNGKDLGIVGRS